MLSLHALYLLRDPIARKLNYRVARNILGSHYSLAAECRSYDIVFKFSVYFICSLVTGNSARTRSLDDINTLSNP